MNPSTSLEDVIWCVRSVPALPRVVHELTDALQHDTVLIEDVVRIISRDQALMGAALRLANSSFYGFSGRITTLSDAVKMLGLRTLCAAVMTTAVMGCFERCTCPGFDADGVWRHAIATAMCAQMLARLRGLDEEAAYTAGLLHDVGQLVLANHAPQEFQRSLSLAAAHDLYLMEAERQVLGADHAQVGAMLATHWQLAPSLATAIRWHHDPTCGQGLGLVDLIHLADNITHALDLANGLDEMVPPMSLSSWKRIALSDTELNGLFEGLEDRMRYLGDGSTCPSM